MFSFKPKPLFESKNQPMKLVALFSGNAGSAKHILKQTMKKPVLKKKMQLVGAFTDNKYAPGANALRDLGVEVKALDFNRYCVINNINKRDLKQRKKYFQKALNKINQLNPDFLMLSGFMKILTEPVLSKFNYRILNVHPADLTILEKGKPKFTGANVVFDAIKAGESEVRASIHFVTKSVDCGPVLVLSKPVKVNKKKAVKLKKKEKKLQEYADSVQEELKRKGDDPAFLKALELVAEGRVAGKKGQTFIKEKGKWKQGYFDLKTNRVESY